nr:MAG TPA: hypothetical protein [Caudoviricetes sp.]
MYNYKKNKAGLISCFLCYKFSLISHTCFYFKSKLSPLKFKSIVITYFK